MRKGQPQRPEVMLPWPKIARLLRSVANQLSESSVLTVWAQQSSVEERHQTSDPSSSLLRDSRTVSWHTYVPQ